MLTKSLFEHATVPTDEQQCQGLREKVNEESPEPDKKQRARNGINHAPDVGTINEDCFITQGNSETINRQAVLQILAVPLWDHIRNTPKLCSSTGEFSTTDSANPNT
jgi:hypothetical protein